MITDCKKWMLTGIFAVLLAMLPVRTANAYSPFWGTEETSGDYTYGIYDDGTAVIAKYTGDETNVTVPATLNGHKVSCIGGTAFMGCSKIKSIELPDGLVSILALSYADENTGSGAFCQCTGLTSITIPDTVTDIGMGAFYGCSSLKSVKLGEKVTEIGGYAFAKCGKLTSVAVPSKVTKIGAGAFYECENLQTVALPNGVKELGEKVFEGCISLKRITIPSTAESIPHRAFFGCTGLKTLTIADGVAKIEQHAFKECDGLTSVKIPGSVKTIEKFAFYDCDKLKSVTLEEGIKEIGGGVFANCWNLKKLRIPASVTKLGYGITHAGVKLEVYKGTAGLKYAKQFFKEYYQPYEVFEKPKALSKAKVSSISQQTYTGKNIKPAVTVKYGSKVLKAGTDYTLKFSNNKAVGKATVTITGKGSYSGTVTKTFTIGPKPTTISKLTAKSKGFTAKWKKQSSQTSGYQIQYSTSSKFTAKTTETVTISKNKTTSKKFSKLKGSTKYYVRIRTYKTVTISGKSQKIYSSWSKSKTIRTKK